MPVTVVNRLVILTLGNLWHTSLECAPRSIGQSVMRSLLVLAVVLALLPNSILGQTLTRRPEQPTSDGSVTSVPQPTPKSILLSVPRGMALKVVLDQTVRIRRVGQPIHGAIVEPVYAFDQMVIPAGAAIAGEISAIVPVLKRWRIAAAMNGEFSPSRQVHSPLDSAHSRKGGPVEALITQPLVNSGHLYLPEGSRLSGSVMQVRPAGSSTEMASFVSHSTKSFPRAEFKKL